jgi:chitin-binding protein
VQYNNKRYMAKWYTVGQNPAQFSGQWDVWLDLGYCVTTSSASSKSSVAASASSRSSVQASSVKSSVAASSSAGGKCVSPAYVDGSGYATGVLVQNAGSEYKCLVGGWCTVGGPYAPGVGWAWTNAWSLVQSCQ